MHIRGLIRSAELQEYPPGSDRIELVLRLQGVGPNQPRSVVIPFSMLVADESLEAENLAGRGLEADVEQDEAQRWVVSQVAFSARVLRGQS